MAKPILAIDIDEVLFPFTENLAIFHNERYGTSLTTHDFSTFYLEQVWGGTAADAFRKVSEFQQTGAITRLGPIPGAVEGIKALKGHYKLVIVTSRQSTIQKETGSWLERHFPETFAGVHFANYWDPELPKVSKADVCGAIGAEILIEDHLDYARVCAGRGIRVLLFGDYPWNQADSLPKGIERIEDWDGILGRLLPSGTEIT